MRNTIFCLIMLSTTFCSSGQVKKGYEIAVNISGLQDSTIFLAYHMGDKQYIKDTIKLDSKGSAVFSGEENLPQGIYMIVLPGKQYFEILMSTDQYFSVNCTYTDYFNTLKFSGSDENSAFIVYQKRWVEMQKKASAINKRLQNNRQNTDSLRILSEMQKKQEDSMKSYLHDVIKENNGNLLSLLVKAMLPAEIPPVSVPQGSKNPDSIKWVLTYLYNKDHFFDNIDINDERLLRTPILQARLNTFFTNVLIQSTDTISKEIDKMIGKVKDNYKVFQFISVYLFNHFRESEIMGHDAIVVKLADEIYLSGKADWVSKDFKDDLRKQVDRIRPNLIGKKAQDLVMDSYKGIFVSLYDIKKEFTILYFWEPDCGHCAEATPKLKAYYDKVKDQGVEVFSVCTTGERAKWEKYIEEHKLDWINGWDPERRTNFGYYYNVESTPMIYILDRDKTIIAKKLSVDDIASFIDNYRKYFKK
ncbi:MAG: thioredoxin-like domain-containing protein [Bacteroidia bacterium]|nr:thioredoxin-like domain-containing protein [Bacteroidia bacterium]